VRISVFTSALDRGRRHHVTDSAAALAYYSFSALPSILLVSLGAFSLAAGRPAVHALAARLDRVAPAQAVSLFQQSLDRVVSDRRSGLVLVAVGIVLALWTATGAMAALQRGLNSAYECPETRGFLVRRLTALRMIAVAVAGLVPAFGLLVLGPQLSKWIGNATGLQPQMGWIWWIAQWPVLVAGLLVAAKGLLQIGPSVERPRRGLLAPGPLFAAVGWLASSALFALYVSRFGSYNKTWGSLSAVIVTLVWLWLGGLVLLLGAEVDAASETASVRTRRRILPGELAPPVGGR
jgi:membrane protein